MSEKDKQPEIEHPDFDADDIAIMDSVWKERAAEKAKENHTSKQDEPKQ